MKKYTILTIALALLVISCNNDDVDEQNGYSSIKVTAERMIALDEPLDQKDIDFSTYTIQTKGVGNYDQTKDFSQGILIPELRAGEYVIRVSSHPEMPQAAFETPYYSGEKTIQARSGMIENVNILCSQANAGLFFNFDALKGHSLQPTVTSENGTLSYEGVNLEKTGYFVPGTASISFTNSGSGMTINGNSSLELSLSGKNLYKVNVLSVEGTNVNVMVDMINTETNDITAGVEDMNIFPFFGGASYLGGDGHTRFLIELYFINGSGLEDVLHLYGFLPETDFENFSLPEGTYTVDENDTKAPFTLEKGYGMTSNSTGGTHTFNRGYNIIVTGSVTQIIGGTCQIVKNSDDTYTIITRFRVMDPDSRYIFDKEQIGIYSGPVHFENEYDIIYEGGYPKYFRLSRGFYRGHESELSFAMAGVYNSNLNTEDGLYLEMYNEAGEYEAFDPKPGIYPILGKDETPRPNTLKAGYIIDTDDGGKYVGGSYAYVETKVGKYLDMVLITEGTLEVKANGSRSYDLTTDFNGKRVNVETFEDFTDIYELYYNYSGNLYFENREDVIFEEDFDPSPADAIEGQFEVSGTTQFLNDEQTRKWDATVFRVGAFKSNPAYVINRWGIGPVEYGQIVMLYTTMEDGTQKLVIPSGFVLDNQEIQGLEIGRVVQYIGVADRDIPNYYYFPDGVFVNGSTDPSAAIFSDTYSYDLGGGTKEYPIGVALVYEIFVDGKYIYNGFYADIYSDLRLTPVTENNGIPACSPISTFGTTNLPRNYVEAPSMIDAAVISTNQISNKSVKEMVPVKLEAEAVMLKHGNK